MGLLNYNDTNSLQELQIKATKEIATDVAMLRDLLILNYNKIMRKFWNHPHLTAQEIADGLGSNATDLFILGNSLRNLIVSVDPASESELDAAEATPTFHENGTVTLVYPEPPPEPTETTGEQEPYIPPDVPQPEE